MNRAVLPGKQYRADLFGPHSFHLTRHAGHQHRNAAVRLKPRAGRGPMGVGQLVPVGGNKRLFAVVRRGGAAGTGKKRKDFLPFFLIKTKGIAEGLRHGLLGQVILRGAKPARKDQQFTARFCLTDQFAQTVGVVPDDVLMQNTDAKFGQFTAQELGIGVDDITEQQFGSYTDNLRRHGYLPFRSDSIKNPGHPRCGWESSQHFLPQCAPVPQGPAWLPRQPRFRQGWALS